MIEVGDWVQYNSQNPETDHPVVEVVGKTNFRGKIQRIQIKTQSKIRWVYENDYRLIRKGSEQ